MFCVYCCVYIIDLIILAQVDMGQLEGILVENAKVALRRCYFSGSANRTLVEVS